MPISSITDPSKELTTLKATGEIAFADIMQAVDGFKDTPPARNILWDFSSAYPSDRFDSTDMDEIASTAKENLSLREIRDGKTAYVATSDFVFGITRMYTSHLEMQGIMHRIKVFRTLDEAHRWLEDQDS